MSTAVITRTDLDVYVSIALRWTEGGDVSRMPPEAAAALTVTPATADVIGALLWEVNHDVFNYEVPRRLLDPKELAEYDEYEDDLVVMPDYRFDAVPGVPRPETALRRAVYYSYQTVNGTWGSPETWEVPGVAPFELRFTRAMQWWALTLLGETNDPAPRWSAVQSPEVTAHQSAAYDASGWRLSESDRDLFLRLA